MNMSITSKLRRTRKECVQLGREWRKDYLNKAGNNGNDRGKENRARRKRYQ